MPVSLYDLSIPVFIRGLSNLAAFLKKAEDYANEKQIPHSELLNARLVDDMAALPFQIQRVSDTAKGVTVRVGGAENVVMEDTETTFEDLQTRISRTIDLLNRVDKGAFEGKETAEVVMKLRGEDRKFTSETYLLKFALPNFYFHVTTAYAILRHKGVPVGKMDFLGPA
ncbi:uncharacterized protein K441DRAFT_654169 [Cenococcum geophilum 1.58]|uniref:uncharacterized protein n=1 Tax=Cenococcum geophilum 1.58 TaxID=794803 RepID=UPI00358E6F75|nr:hypothetical protein K441DRAFT_654169 [Cenococcum geophilum 1.58]